MFKKIKLININLHKSGIFQETCTQYNSGELYQLLQSVGGVNQKFMADSPESAGVNFLDLIPNANSDMIANEQELSWTANNFETVLRKCILQFSKCSNF